jgi:hypothetical protein
MSSLKSLEAVSGPGSQNLRWVLISWETSETIIPLLDYYASPNQGRCQKVMEVVASLLLPDGKNARSISKAISLLGRRTPKGAEACLSVLDAQKDLPKSAAEDLLADWLQSSEISSSDKEALNALSKVIGLTALEELPEAEPNYPAVVQENLSVAQPAIPVEIRPILPVEMEASLPVATDHLRHEYFAIIDEARRLDKMRLVLKNHDERRTSNLLTRLGIEDPVTPEKTFQNIPPSLVDVVEDLGDNEYEFCFPLTYLNPSRRVDLGMGNARALLVRFSLGTRGSSPGFCLHLHPEHNRRVDNGSIDVSASQTRDGHHYWRASSTSSPPNNHFCFGKPNRTTYQLNRACWRLLRTRPLSLERLYNTVSSEIKKMAFVCVVCGHPPEAQKPRMNSRVSMTITCQPSCAQKFAESDTSPR